LTKISVKLVRTTLSEWALGVARQDRLGLRLAAGRQQVAVEDLMEKPGRRDRGQTIVADRRVVETDTLTAIPTVIHRIIAAIERAADEGVTVAVGGWSPFIMSRSSTPHISNLIWRNGFLTAEQGAKLPARYSPWRGIRSWPEHRAKRQLRYRGWEKLW
jgi:hypothetical protein